jgi:hypothetical protein
MKNRQEKNCKLRRFKFVYFFVCVGYVLRVNNAETLETPVSTHPCGCELCRPGPVQNPPERNDEDGDDNHQEAVSIAQWSLRGTALLVSGRTGTQ